MKKKNELFMESCDVLFIQGVVRPNSYVYRSPYANTVLQRVRNDDDRAFWSLKSAKFTDINNLIVIQEQKKSHIF